MLYFGIAYVYLLKNHW